jgi:2-polyprenyl-3-methyl-5-hydroxy-6-metoxy-1,4-benzoquinol methylase
MSTATRPLDRGTARDIARAFLPASRMGSRWDYHYARMKLASDPLYPGVADALRGTTTAVLDLGCGLGLLAHTLRAAGLAMPYHGVDVDARKIGKAARVAAVAGLRDVAFDTVDLTRSLPAHSGSVAILDVLQYVDADAQAAIVDAAAAMLAPGGRLVIRTGLDDGSRRLRITHAADTFGRMVGWMYSRPRRYPSEAMLRERLGAAGLQCVFMPLSGDTPFNNGRVVAQRAR